MVSAAPWVDPNPPAVQARPYGLRAVLRTLGTLEEDSSDPHWANGVIWEYLTCAPASGVGPDCDTPLGIPKTFERQETVTDLSRPFALYGSYTCSPIGRPFTEAFERAQAQLLMHEDFGIEKAVWDGSLNNAPAIMSADTFNLTPGSSGQGSEDGTATSTPGALNLLEQFASQNYGGLGVIHIPFAASPFFWQANLLIHEDGIVKTHNGTPVVLGAGYVVNTGPAGGDAPTGEAWAAITPLPKLFRSPEVKASERQLDTLDRENNDSLAIAERVYLANWDGCPVAAARFELSCC